MFAGTAHDMMWFRSPFPGDLTFIVALGNEDATEEAVFSEFLGVFLTDGVYSDVHNSLVADDGVGPSPPAYGAGGLTICPTRDRHISRCLYFKVCQAFCQT